MKQPDALELEFIILLFIVGAGFVSTLLYGIAGLLSLL